MRKDPTPVPPRIVYFDLETQKSAEEVGGWGHADKMLMSVGCIWDAITEEFEDYEEHQVQELIEKLAAADLVVGFNTVGFDYKVLKGYTMLDFKTIPSFDMIQAVHKANGFRVGLGTLGQETLGVPKSADGLQALEWFKEGKMEEITEYCRQDVALTRDLFRHGVKDGNFRYNTKRGPGSCFVNWNLPKILEEAKRAANAARI